jgi:hypothetical protein
MPLEHDSPFIKIAVLENAIKARHLSSVLTPYENLPSAAPLSRHGLKRPILAA